MEDFVRYFMGEALGNLTINGWKWLWRMPSRAPETAKTSDDIILEDITRSLEALRFHIAKNQKVVDVVRHNTQEQERQYNLRQQHYQELITKISASGKDSSLIEVREMMATAIQIERTLPQQKLKLEHLQQIFIDSREDHAKKQSDLLLLELDLQAATTRMAINKSSDRDPNLGNSPDLITLQQKIQQVSEQAEDRYQKTQWISQLSNSSDCVLSETLSLQDIDNRIRDLNERKSSR
jgi:hypothetical protein